MIYFSFYSAQIWARILAIRLFAVMSVNYDSSNIQ
jgi:hypothetical protein